MADHRIYELRWTRRKIAKQLADLLPYEVASCDGDSLPFALATLREEGQLTDDSRIGILYRPDAEGPGVWLINPWATGREE